MHELSSHDIVAEEGVVSTPAIRQTQRRCVAVQSLVLVCELHELGQIRSLARDSAGPAMGGDDRYSSFERRDETCWGSDSAVELWEHMLPSSMTEQG